MKPHCIHQVYLRHAARIALRPFPRLAGQPWSTGEKQRIQPSASLGRPDTGHGEFLDSHITGSNGVFGEYDHHLALVVEIKGLMVSLNRCERGKGEKSALQEIQELYGFPANAIVSMEEVVEYLYNRTHDGKIIIDDAMKASIDAYYAQYGVK